MALLFALEISLESSLIKYYKNYQWINMNTGGCQKRPLKLGGKALLLKQAGVFEMFVSSNQLHTESGFTGPVGYTSGKKITLKGRGDSLESVEIMAFNHIS